MKLKSLLLVCCLGLFSSAFAANMHMHPKAEKEKSKQAVSWPGYCEIEVVNRSFENVVVSGEFDDGSPLIPFNIYSYGFDTPHYISLYYFGRCHAGMILHVDTFSGYPLYSAYTYRQSTVTIVPYLKNQVKAQVQVQQK